MTDLPDEFADRITPTIKPYDEAAWAKLADVKAIPVETSLALLDALHARWVAFAHVTSLRERMGWA
jgi:hypothetical protein